MVYLQTAVHHSRVIFTVDSESFILLDLQKMSRNTLEKAFRKQVCVSKYSETVLLQGEFFFVADRSCWISKI